VESVIIIRDLGITAYADCLALQEDLCAGRQADAIANTVLLTEHEPVVTLGARKSENKLIWTRGQLAEKNIALCPAGRGGGTTAHNPGQIVIYPIVKLKTLRMGLTDYVQTLGRIGIELLGRFGIAASWRKDAPGLWIGDRKIASVGVQARKWVTMHGMAINICNDLSIFEAIVPCGLEDVEMTSVLKETGQSPPMSEVKAGLSELCRRYLCPAEASVHEQP
jgi:lipoate-protein ligase B